jgi:hypothetical protein
MHGIKADAVNGHVSPSISSESYKSASPAVQVFGMTVQAIDVKSQQFPLAQRIEDYVSRNNAELEIDRPVFKVNESIISSTVPIKEIKSSLPTVTQVEINKLESKHFPYAENLRHGRAAMAKATLLFRHGTNTAEESPNWGAQDNALIHMLRDWQDKKESEYEVDHNVKGVPFAVLAQITKEAVELFGGGQCCERAYVTAAILIEEGKVSPVEYWSIGKHALLVIGRAKDSDPKDMRTWGPAVFVDAWAKKYYPVLDFQKMKLPENDVKYPASCYNDGLPPPPSYLEGEMELIDSWEKNVQL